jgi:lipopolysaccharide/colanic/teichoic acid biosynthesis glycosyltransferase
MKALLQKKSHAIPRRRSQVIFYGNDGVLGEHDFIELLAFERKRSERSGKPFLLMTLTILGSSELRNRSDAMRGAEEALSVFGRQTDIKGWYSPSTLGVIFTETDDIDTKTLRNKIAGRLRNQLTEVQFGAIRISFHTYPDEGNASKPGNPGDLTFYPDYQEKMRSQNIALTIKRIVDVIGSIAGILIFSPFFIMIPALIKLTSPGPVLFRQERVGQYGKHFTFLKFRSMYVNNNADVHKEYVHNLIAGKTSAQAGSDGAGKNIYKITDDKRVTPLGKILRKTSLDELPQFFNVLGGDMSLAGPRPPIPYEIEKYEIWHRRRIMEVKPGITGLWQVEGRSSTTFDEMVRLDIRYARTWSLWLDMKILWRTVRAVISREGVSAEGHATMPEFMGDTGATD